jgi:ethanolamine ammonia-lyase small subunit
LRSLIQSGGVEGDAWCLLVPNSAVAAKLRQTLPALCAHLRAKGWDVNTIRVKVSATR